MYLIKDINRKKIKLVKDTDVSLNTLKLFYNEFYPNSKIIVFKNYYPESFITDVFKNTNVVDYNKYQIEFGFIKWIFSGILKSFHFVNGVPKKISNEVPIVVHEQVPIVVHEHVVHEQVPIVVHEHVVHEQVPIVVHEHVVHEQVPIVVHEHVVHEQVPIEIPDSTEINSSEVANNSSEVDEPAQDDEIRNYDLVIEYNNHLTQDDEIMNYDLVKAYNDHDGYTPFNDRDEILLKTIKQDDNIMVVNYFNSVTKQHDIALILQNEENIKYMKNLNSLMLSEITINNISFLKASLLSKELLASCDIYKTLVDPNEYLQKIYKMTKFMKDKVNKDVLIKCVFEFIHSYYDVDFNSTLNYEDFLNCFSTNHFRTNLNMILCDEQLLNILDFFGFIFQNNKIFYLKPKTSKAKIDLNISDDAIYRCISVKNHRNFHDIRSIPEIGKRNKHPGVWNISSESICD